MWKVKAHGCGNTAPATECRARKLSGTERTLEQNRAAPAQGFDCKGVALSPWEKSLLFACQHMFLCLPHMDESCGSLARFRPRPGCQMTVLQPSLSFSPLVALSQQEWMLPRAGPCPLKVGRVSTGPSCQVSQHHS